MENQKDKELVDGMNTLINLVLAKQDKSVQIVKEYELKLKNLTDLLNHFLQLNSKDQNSLRIVSTNHLDDILSNGLKYCTEDSIEYCMIPVTHPVVIPDKSNTPLEEASQIEIQIPFPEDNEEEKEKIEEKKKKKKKKKNNILCSYCNVKGHMRSKCPKKLFSNSDIISQ